MSEYDKDQMNNSADQTHAPFAANEPFAAQEPFTAQEFFAARGADVNQAAPAEEAIPAEKAAAAAAAPAASRDEWERQQREIQDREWQHRQQLYNEQLAVERAQPNDSRWQPNADRRQADAAPEQPYYAYGYRAQNSAPTQNAAFAQNYTSAQDHTQNFAQNPASAQGFAQPPAPVFAPVYTQPPIMGGAPTGGTVVGGMPAAAAAPPHSEEKRSRRKSRLQLFAAGLAGAFLAAVLFTTGYFAGNAFQRQDAGAPTTQTAANAQNAAAGSDSDAAATSSARQQPSSGQRGSSGAAGLLPSDGAQEGGEAAAAQQQTQESQQAAQSGVPSGLSSLTLNPPLGNDLTVPGIYQKVYPSIVGVRITFQYQGGYGFGGFMLPGDEQSGEGSGIIIRSDGYIMTNHHVVSEAIDSSTHKQADGAKIEVFLPDDITKAYPATLVGYDQSTDLAVLKIDKKDLQAAELGDSDKLVVGEGAVAIGNPGGMEYMSSVTVGVISGLNRTIQTEGYRNIQLIQTDAAINPGNSGGALINSKGQVIGVNSIKIAASAFEGLGFAIPINAAVTICEDLMTYTYVTGRPFIGITAYSQYTEQMAEQYDMPKGVYVYEVDETGPAAGAGIKKNDIIVKFGSADVTNFETLETAKNKMKPGDKVTITVYRGWSANNYTNGQNVDIELTLGEMKN
jgi:serine protease Do